MSTRNRYRNYAAEGAGGAELGIAATDERLAGDRWMLVWAVDPLGECCCRLGTRRWQGSNGGAAGAVGMCGDPERSASTPGKHPWWIHRDGEKVGFPHGSADAMSLPELRERFGRSGGARLAMTLQDLVLVDIDSERSLRDFCRLRRTIGRDKILAVAKSPRGWHVYLRCPGWNQRALNLWLSAWLDGWGWDPVNPDKLTSRRGLVLDFRTGARRYVVWPESSGESGRRWARAGEFKATLERAERGMPEWRWVAERDEPGGRAPWNLEMTPDLRAWVGEYDQKGGTPGQSGWSEEFGGAAGGWTREGVSSPQRALQELDRWCGRLAVMGVDTGRNNMLNQIAFLDGAAAVRAGVDRSVVEEKLREAADACGCPGAEATIRSGLDAGLR